MAQKKLKKRLFEKWDFKVKLIYLIVLLVLLFLGYFIASGLYNQIESQSITKVWP